MPPLPHGASHAAGFAPGGEQPRQRTCPPGPRGGRSLRSATPPGRGVPGGRSTSPATKPMARRDPPRRPAGQERLEPWCASHGADEGLVERVLRSPGRDPARRGANARRRARARPFDRAVARAFAPAEHLKAARPGSRAATASDADPLGDVLQAGAATRAADGEVGLEPDADDEGFRAGAEPVDPDPHRRATPARRARPGKGRIVAVASDGGSRHDAGLRSLELARLMIALGASARSSSSAAARRRGSPVSGCGTSRGRVRGPQIPAVGPLSTAREFRAA